MKNQSEILIIENYDEDEKLRPWRNQLRDAGVRSLILCPINYCLTMEKDQQEKIPQELLLIGHESPRTWDRAEQELVKIVSKQLNVILRQWQLNQRIKSQEEFNQALDSCWSILKTTNQLQQLEKQFIEKISQLLKSSLVVLLTWTEGEKRAKIVNCVARKSELLLNSDRLISVVKDPLIQHALSTKELFFWPVNQLSAYTRQWFTSSVEKILVTSLYTASEHHPTGLLIIADPEQIQAESGISLTMLNLLVMQFAWSRRYLRIQDFLKTEHEELQWLNWYKQRRLEELYRTVGGGLKQLNELNQSPFQSTDPQKTQLSNLRYQQLLRQMGSALASTSSLIKQEQWRLHHQNDIISITNLLRRVRERISAIIRNKQIQLVIKQQENFNVIGDHIKLELVFYEILLTTCHRAEPGGLIEIITQPLNDQQLELMIIDYGIINPQLILELKTGYYPDLLAPSLLTSPPGQQLLICQQMLEKMGGELLIGQGENRQIITQVILGLSPAN
ncbi:MAG TPA: hypothetical protein DCQ63_12530 [Planktothrix sp. UBA8402]|nr:hypothetical protein [Planktothrix sp. UBA8402]